MRQFYFDALTHDDKALAFLIEQVGADRVTLGTDAPLTWARKIRSRAGYSARLTAQTAIGARLNALGLLGEKVSGGPYSPLMPRP